MLYTTPADPWTIKYKIVMQSIGNKVRDNVLNEWDMNTDTPDIIEEKGILVFEVKPKDTAGDDFIEWDSSATKYEEIP